MPPSDSDRPLAVSVHSSEGKTLEFFKKHFPKSTPEQVARAAGAISGMTVSVGEMEGSLMVKGRDHTKGGFILRHFHPVENEDGSTHLVLEHTSQEFPPSRRGEGYQRFATQLGHLSKLPQVKKITIPYAAGSGGSTRNNGFYTWPRYGFNAKLQPEHWMQLPTHFWRELSPEADFHELFAHPQGAEVWKKEGKQIDDMEFDLHPESEHRKRFQAYYDQRKQQSEGSGKAVRESVPSVPPVAAQPKADSYRTEDQVAETAAAVGVRYGLKDQKFSTVLLPVQGELRQKVLELANKVPDHLLAGNGRETDPHLTLLYGLHSSDHKPIQDLFANAEGKIGFRLGKVSVFKNPDFDVLKVEVHSPDAHKANALLKTLPHTSTYPNYSPHLTLAYVKSGEGERLAKELGSVEGEGFSDQLTFSDPDRNHTPIRIGAAKYKQELAGGKWQGKSIRQALVSEGAKVEREHTTDPQVAAEIAKDHLTEDRNYYPKLKVTEKLTLADLKAALRRKKGSKVKYAKEKPTYSPLISHAAAVLDNPDLGAVGAFADHLAEFHADHPVTKALHRWINGEPLNDTLLPVLHQKTPHQVTGPLEADGKLKAVEMGVTPTDRDNIPEGIRAFRKFKGDSHWTEVIPLSASGRFSRIPKSSRKVGSAEVAQHLFDTGGLASLVYGVVGAQHWHPERQKERDAGTRQKVATFYGVKYSTEQQAVAHPSVAGFQLEHALRRAISDPETTSELKSLSHALLTQGVERSDAAYGIHDEVEGMHPDHWLRKAGYNWLAIPHKLHLDAAISVALAQGVGGPDPVIAPSAFSAAAAYDPSEFHEGSPTRRAAEAAAILKQQGHSLKDIQESADRLLRRAGREWTGTQDQAQQQATQPITAGHSERYAAKGKNPEGGLTVAEARRQGIRAGSETANAAKKAGGFSKIEGKTQKRRKSFCSRMCGAAKQHPEAAKDPDSRLRASLRIWGCRCNAKKG